MAGAAIGGALAGGKPGQQQPEQPAQQEQHNQHHSQESNQHHKQASNQHKVVLNQCQVQQQQN